MPSGGQLDRVPVELIELDTSNPRIAAFLEHYEPPHTPEQIYIALGAGGDDDGNAGPTFGKLKQSILTNRGIIQPVILNRVANGRFLCIEGNTRVALYRDFLAQGVPGSWSTIPAIVHGDLEPEDVHAIRLQAHLVGPRPWNPYSKAKYLHRLRTVEHFPLNQLVDFCGGNQRAVVEALDAYTDMEQYYRPLLAADNDFDASRFSGFVELQKPGVKDALLRAGFTLGDFARWIIEGRIEKLAHVRWLPKVLRDKRATKVFLEQDIEYAIKVLDQPDLSKALQDAPLASLCRALIEAVDRIGYREVKQMREDPTSSTAQYLVEAHEALKGIVADVGLA